MFRRKNPRRERSTLFRRIFRSRKTARAAILCVVLLILGECATGILSGVMTRFEYFDLAVRLLLCVFLFHGYRRQSVLTLQGGCSGLLICMTYSQAHFVLNDLSAMSTDSFVTLGFWGSFYLAGELMLMILEVILTANHFVLFILKKKNPLRVSVNQVTMVIMLAFLLFQTFVVTRIATAWSDFPLYGLFNLGLIAIFVLIGCAEFTLASEDAESKG